MPQSPVSHSICIFEDAKFSDFYPLALSQPLFDLRIGAGTLRSRWSEETPREALALICREYLGESVKLAVPHAAVNELRTTDTLFINARWLCFGDERERFLSSLPENAIALKGNAVVAARTRAEAAGELAAALGAHVSDAAIDAACRRHKARAANPHDDGDTTEIPADIVRVIDTHRLRQLEFAEARLIDRPWDLMAHNSACIVDDFTRRTGRRGSSGNVPAGVQLIEKGRIAVATGADLRAGVVIDASDGPVVIGARARIMPNAVVIGPAAIGADSVVKPGARLLGGTSIGSVCKVGGEVDETIFADYSNKQHDGFIGHSYIGSWANLGAASNNSDLKNNYGTVRMWSGGRFLDSGRQFLGLVLGDHTKTGINAVFNTGTVVGFNCNLYSSEMPDAFVPSFSWGHGRELTPYRLDKAMETAAIVMQRRGVVFSEVHRRIFERIHAIVAASGGNA
ncbi:MAG TPA: putative sugar nucleotidyl transferase [Candidatus Krumholzibacteria bacterium]|nr:putative sugar nucleotidyl transferase [Candidatus Krumholzibacteria bacterium]